MNVKNWLLSYSMLTGILVTSCTNDEIISVNPDPVGNAIAFSPQVGRATRATETVLNNLGDFGVYARAVDGNGDLYGNLIIGDEKTGPRIAKRSVSANNKWELTDGTVEWPNDVPRIFFWGITALQGANTANQKVTGDNGTLSFNMKSGPQLSDFAPKRVSDRSKTYYDGREQQDLVVAYTDQRKETGQSNIKMTFNHALSQIVIRAKVGEDQPETNKRILKLKGVWVVNVEDKATLNAGFSASKEGGVLKVEEKTEWRDINSYTGQKCIFGSYTPDNPMTIDKSDPVNILQLNNSLTDAGSLMLIPQQVVAWDGNPGATEEDRYEFNSDQSKNASGTYILLLCRIESVHTESHEGAPTDTHNHLLFPHEDNTSEDAYGYTCVPIGGTTTEDGKFFWEMGKRYTYTLNIVGANSGGGVYPPDIPEELPKTDIDPDKDKKPGDPVLNDPISFEVEVNEWKEDKDWNGDINMK